MTPILIYFLKVNIAIALFYALYRLFFSRDTFFGWRRGALLCFFAVALLHPLLNIQEWVRGSESLVVAADRYAVIMLPEVDINAATESSANGWVGVLSSTVGYLYLGAVALLLVRLLVRLASIAAVRLRSSKARICGHNVFVLNGPDNPFSFFGWIFVHPQSHTQQELEEIIAHELTHSRQWHSIDVLISELLCVACCFNPFVWLLKREVKNNLEFLADNSVLEKGYEQKAYQYHLLRLSCHRSATALYNDFNVLPLKNRIKMMNKKRTKRIGKTKYVLFIPVVASLLIVSNIDVIARNAVKPVSPLTMPQDTIKPPPAIPDDDQLFEVVEVQPSFPGGYEKLMPYFRENIKYPEAAQKNKVQGRVVVQFVVNKDGSISDVVTVRGIDPDLDKEAVRVASEMPKWEPGMQRGKPVRVKYTVPVLFQLTEEISQPVAGGQ